MTTRCTNSKCTRRGDCLTYRLPTYPDIDYTFTRLRGGKSCEQFKPVTNLSAVISAAEVDKTRAKK